MDILTLDEAFVAMHEMYLSMLKAGFSEEQALYLVSRVLVENNNKKDDNDN